MSFAFEGIKNLYGADGLDKIQKSHFLVIGIGGVGSWICEALARSGATHLTIVDLDDICVSNINRQIHALATNTGKQKIDEMKKRLLSINPNINVNCVHDFYSEESSDEILSNNYTFIFDAIDSLKSKCILIAKCKEQNIPLICIGGSGGKMDPTKIEIKDLNHTINDSLLFHVRKKLRKNFGFWRYYDRPFKIPTVFSTELAKEASSDNCYNDKKINCQSGLGSASFVTASFGFAAVSYVLSQVTMHD